MSEKLTPEQGEAVASWIASGAKLGEVQKRLLEEFGISMTYMDVRFLVDDMDLTVKDPKPAEAAPAAQQPADEAPLPEGGGVRVEVSPVQRPGMITGGTVKFSDGVEATWELDQDGRLHLGGAAPDYRPSQEDLLDFQQKLRTILGG